MSNTTIRHFGRMQTRDGRMLARDMMLTTNNRLTAEPAPEVRPVQMGVRYDGTGGVPSQVDLEVLFNSFVGAVGLLSPAEVARMKTLMLQYAGSTPGPTNQVGITATDAVRRGIDAVNAINESNKAFWDARTAADERRVFGR